MSTKPSRRRAFRRLAATLIATVIALVLTALVVPLRRAWLAGGGEVARADLPLAEEADEDEEATLAPAVAPAAATGDASAPEAAASSVSDDDAGAEAPVEAIELAIAPDGGVPYHPDATTYRSPFARPGKAVPARAKVALLLNSVDDYDVRTGTFTADFFLSFTSATPMPPLGLTAANGTIEETKVFADRPTFKLLRLHGKFKSPPNLRNYPFDEQELKIVLEDDTHGIDQLRFSVDKERTQLARGFRALGWQVSELEARVLSQSYPDRFEGDDLYYSRYVFTLSIERFATSAAFKVFVPALVIVLISLLGMWVPANEMEVRANSGAPMLAGAVLFHFALMQELPATSYMTRADKLMLGVYLSLALGMLSTWLMFVVEKENVGRVFTAARVVVPVVSVVVMAAAAML